MQRSADPAVVLEGSGTESEAALRERIGELAERNARLEQELAQRERAQELLAARVEALARSNAELEQFAYVASHDLQQPLVAVIGFLRLLEQRYGSRFGEDGRAFIDQALDGANRMQLLIRDLLDYSRAHSSGEPHQPVACEALLDDALANLGAAIEESGAVITRDALPTVVGAPTQLSQLFQNLVSNALKFVREKPPRVHVSAVCGADEWVFSVRDNGIGIAPQDRERIFGVFERLHRRAGYPGTGIGLAICKKAVERHGGRIWVESEPGVGSTFYFTLPQPPPEAEG